MINYEFNSISRTTPAIATAEAITCKDREAHPLFSRGSPLNKSLPESRRAAFIRTVFSGWVFRVKLIPTFNTFQGEDRTRLIEQTLAGKPSYATSIRAIDFPGMPCEEYLAACFARLALMLPFHVSIVTHFAWLVKRITYGLAATMLAEMKAEVTEEGEEG